MRHQHLHHRLNRTSTHRRAMLRNMAIALFRHERIETTDAKAKALKPFAEKLITLSKRGDLHARREAARYVHDHDILRKLFDELAERYRTRAGGYTRVLKTGFRRGDAAPMSLIELVDAKLKSAVTTDESKAAEAKPTKKDEAKAAKKDEAKPAAEAKPARPSKRASRPQAEAKAANKAAPKGKASKKPTAQPRARGRKSDG